MRMLTSAGQNLFPSPPVGCFLFSFCWSQFVLFFPTLALLVLRRLHLQRELEECLCQQDPTLQLYDGMPMELRTTVLARRLTTPVHAIFGGQLMSAIKCGSCGWQVRATLHFTLDPSLNATCYNTTRFKKHMHIFLNIST